MKDNFVTISKYMMLSSEAAKYLNLKEATLMASAEKFGLDYYLDSLTSHPLFYPEQVYNFKLCGLRDRLLITADELKLAVEVPDFTEEKSKRKLRLL